MCKSPLTVAAVALAILSTAPALAADAGGRWTIDRGANATNVHVSVAPLPDGRSTAAEPGCAPQNSAGAVQQYTFPSSSGVTVYITPGYGAYVSPYGYGYRYGSTGYGSDGTYGSYGGTGYGSDGTYGYDGYGASPRVVVFAGPGGMY